MCCTFPQKQRQLCVRGQNRQTILRSHVSVHLPSTPPWHYQQQPWKQKHRYNRELLLHFFELAYVNRFLCSSNFSINATCLSNGDLPPKIQTRPPRRAVPPPPSVHPLLPHSKKFQFYDQPLHGGHVSIMQWKLKSFCPLCRKMFA